LPPLLLHTFRKGDSSALASWASTLERVGERTTYFNFTASHDGIGVTPVRGILSNDEIDALVQLAEDHGGFVSYKNNADGTRSPYELNITYFDAITDPVVTVQNPETAAARFICSQAIMLALVGVPGIYFHSLFGSRNWQAGAAQTGRSRTINREKLTVAQLQSELADPTSLRHTVFTRYQVLLNIRQSESAFHPLNSQKIHRLHPAVFALERGSSAETVLALHNVTGERVEITLPDGKWLNLLNPLNLINDQLYSGSIVLEAYQVAWLKIIVV
ncbi:MAG: sugar phosphorylase, partial [Chitinophagaceae bacterium]|nr:sugar phosphorylase [Anaerolineae bacterium]